MDDNRLATVEERSAPPHDHAVHVYADDFAIIQELIRFIEDGFALGESVVVVANARHRASVDAWRADHPSIGGNETLLVMDAAQVLQTFMVADSPDPDLFEASVGSMVEGAARGGRRVRVFGEMVAVLWADGNVAGALALEALWNDMAATRRFFLLCGYPAAVLDGSPLQAVNEMCGRHSGHLLLGQQMQFADTPTATPLRSQRLLLATSGAVQVARHIAVRTLVDWELNHLIADGVTVTSELATNAVLQADSAFRLTLSRKSTRLRIAVEDAVPNPAAAVIRFDESKRGGLATVETVASDWGCDVTPHGKTVWAELPL